MNNKDPKSEPAAMTKSPARRVGLTPWLNDWFDFPELSRWFESRPALSTLSERMRIEEEHRDDAVVVRAEMPGIDPEKDVELTIDNGMLRIRAERRQEEREETEGRVRSEFHYGMFTRSIPLPSDVSEDDIKATYKDGVLEVVVPVAKTAEPRKVTVRRG